MASFSYIAILLLALAAISQVAMAASFASRPCREIYPRSGASRKYVKPSFKHGKTSLVNRKLFKASDGTVVKVKHIPSIDGGGDLLLIKTKDNKVDRIELDFKADGQDKPSRLFKLKPNQVCFVRTKTDEEPMTLDWVHYYRKST